MRNLTTNLTPCRFLTIPADGTPHLHDLPQQDAEQPGPHMGASLEGFGLLQKGDERGLRGIVRFVRRQSRRACGTHDLWQILTNDGFQRPGVAGAIVREEFGVAVGDGRLKITGFGLVRLEGSNPIKTTAGMVLATPLYASPDQLRGRDVETLTHSGPLATSDRPS